VAYRYFATPKRKFIVADTPGHVQYTRNMVTGASTANLSIVLVDARLGVIEQTRRHTYIASLLGIPHMVFAVNKMDLVDWSEARFTEIRDEIEGFLPKLGGFRDVKFVPISALNGDNVVDASKHTPWYQGPTLLGHLETVHIASDWNYQTFRFPVQWVNRPNNPTDKSLHDFRGLSGQVASGIVRKGQEVVVLPAGIKSTVKDLWTYDGSVEEAFCPQSVTLCLEHDIDISRGDMIVGLENLPGRSTELQARICWMHQRPLQAGKKYFLKHTTQTVQAIVTQIESRINIITYESEPNPAGLALNDIGVIKVRTAKPLLFDGYSQNRLTGSFILVEQGTNSTVAAGMLFPPTEAVKPEYNDFAI
jgi:sulfate adenylyltransferase subunit 1